MKHTEEKNLYIKYDIDCMSEEANLEGGQGHMTSINVL